MKTTITISLTLLLSSATVAFGQDRRQQGPASLLFRTLDQDQDGVISSAEIKGAVEALAKLDKNGDGKLDSREISGRDSRQRGGDRSSRQRGRGAPRPSDFGTAAGDLGDPGIAWYGRLDTALEEAKRSNRPIMFVAAASQCSGVPGVF